MKRFLIGAALVLTMVVLAGALIIFAVQQRAGSGPLSQTAVVDRTLAVTGAPTLALANSDGSIAITRGAEQTVTIHAVKHAGSAAALDRTRVEITQTGDQVRIETRYDRPAWPFFIGGPSVSYEIGLPASATVAPAKTSNGNIDVTGIAGRLELQTSNGTITLRGVDGDITARTSNGKISVAGASGTLTLATSNGIIEMQEMRARGLDVQTSNGRIAFAGSLAAGSHNRLTTSNGSVTLALPPDFAANIDLRTSSGTVTVGYPLTTQPGGQNTRAAVQGTIGDGGADLTVRTSNGSITLTRQAG